MSQITLKTSASAEQTASSPLAWLSRAGFGVIILLAIALFGWANPVFLTVDNWANLLQGSAILLIVAMAMTLIVSAGAIDLSVGVALDFGAAFALVALKTWHLPWQAAVGCALLGGVLIGLLNAFLILICRIRPFLATLGTWFIASSAERIYTDGGGAIAYRRMAPEYHDLAVGNLGGIPTPVAIVLALWLAGSELDVIAIIGIILLIGIVKKNAIMMIDFSLAAEREQGMPPREAIYQACLLRFRPILMTTLAALLGALPLMLSTGVGAELRRPLGIGMVGGLMLSQVLTLFTTPVIYLLFDRLSLHLKRRFPRQEEEA